ncbi:SWIM zinc finger family protein [Parasphingorhabdus pacifica]
MSSDAGPPEGEGGLRARSRRGEIARTWWSRRFIEVLESFHMSGRLQRGKHYARSGRVLSMSVSTSLVTAQVQGSRATPYRARIAAKAFDGAQWAAIEEALAGRALYAAKLLSGEMPAGIEEVFTELDLELFPASPAELTMDCSCPDWEIPCKHLAATCYLLAEAFDEDPFQILAWRGRGRQELLDRLRSLRGTAPPPDRPVSEVPPLEQCLNTFWTSPPARAPASPAASADRPGAILDELGKPPIAVDGTDLTEVLRRAYSAMRAGPP